MTACKNSLTGRHLFSLFSSLPSSLGLCVRRLRWHRHGGSVFHIVSLWLCFGGALCVSLSCGVGINKAYAGGDGDREAASEVRRPIPRALTEAHRAWFREQLMVQRSAIAQAHVAESESLPTRATLAVVASAIAATDVSDQAFDAAPAQPMLTVLSVPAASVKCMVRCRQ